MPAALVKKVADTCKGIGEKKAEELWNKAKKAAEKEGRTDDYAYITGIFKRMIGGACATKLGWSTARLELIGMAIEARTLANDFPKLKSVQKVAAALEIEAFNLDKKMQMRNTEDLFTHDPYDEDLEEPETEDTPEPSDEMEDAL